MVTVRVEVPGATPVMAQLEPRGFWSNLATEGSDISHCSGQEETPLG